MLHSVSALSSDGVLAAFCTVAKMKVLVQEVILCDRTYGC